MDNSRKIIPSSSTHVFEEEHEGVNPSPLPHHPPNPIPSPPSFNVPSLMHTPSTFLAPMIHEGAPNSINPDGHIGSNTAGMNDVNQTFRDKPIILEIPNGCDVISCVTQFAQRHQLPVTVLCGHGLISQVDFRFADGRTHPHSSYGCYQIISFSGTYNCSSAVSGDIVSSFTVSLVDPQGASVGGLVASTMKAASPVMLVVCFTNDQS